MSYIGASWLADPSNSNVLRQSYVTGFLDVRGNAIIRTDASLSGNIGIGGAVSISNNIGMSGVINQLISIPLQGGFVYQQVNSADALTAIAQVATLNTLVVTGNAVASPALAPYSNPISGNVVTLGTTSVNARLGGISNYVMGNLAVLSDVSLNTRLFLGGDASFGGKLSVSSDASFGGRISVGGDISVNGLSLGLGSQSVRTNTVFGNTALQKIQSSGAAGWINNTAVGYQSLLAATTPLNNTAVGSMSLAANTTGANNTAVGYGAGAFVSTGGNITCLGYNTGFSSGATQYNQSTAIGYNATITGSNQVVLGTAAENVYVPGKLGIGKTSPGYQLDVSGTTMSSGYNPKNISISTNAVAETGAVLMVDATAGSNTNQLGTTAGNYLPIVSIKHRNGNNSYLNAYSYRWASGNDWFTASTRIGQTIDITNQAYIEFNPPGQSNGLGLYTVGNLQLTPASFSGLTITNVGNTGFNNPQPMYRLDVNGTSRLNNSLTFTGAVTGTITPNTTGATGTTWAVGGITYVASASSFTMSPYFAFDTVNTLNNKWIGGGGGPSYKYSTTTGLATSFAATTIVVGQTDISGEWIQIQNSQQLVLNNYNIACSDVTARSPKSFWIVGSNDGVNFFPIQYCTIASNPYSVNTALAGTFVAGTTGTQNGYTTTTFSVYSGNAYFYHRMLITATFIDVDANVAIGDWIINYNKPSTVSLALDGTASGQLNITGDTSVSGNIIQTSGTASNTYKNLYGDAPPTTVYLSSFSPNSTNATSSKWINNNITWTVAASSTFFQRTPYGSFDTSFANQGWGSQNPTYSSTSPFGYSPGAYTAYSTYVNSVGTVSGEWLQISSSVPVVMNSFKITNTNTGDVPSSYSICGSNDATSWYPIMDVSYTSWAYTAQASSGNNYDLNGLTFAIQSGTITAGTISSTGTVVTAKYNSYGNSANSYSYFRFIFKNLLDFVLFQDLMAP